MNVNIKILAAAALVIGWAVSLTGAAYHGYATSVNKVSQEFAEYRAERANEDKARAQADSVAALSLAAAFAERQKQTDDITRQLAAQREAAGKLKKERDYALQAATTGHVCLTANALRVLDGSPGLRVAVSAAAVDTGSADGTHANRIATDTDVGRWALDAGKQYSECVNRFDALIDAAGGPPRG